MITDADDVLTKPFTAGELADRVELARGRASKVALV
jgi:DNA-binding response OmpR family regulator